MRKIVFDRIEALHSTHVECQLQSVAKAAFHAGQNLERVEFVGDVHRMTIQLAWRAPSVLLGERRNVGVALRVAWTQWRCPGEIDIEDA